MQVPRLVAAGAAICLIAGGALAASMGSDGTPAAPRGGHSHIDAAGPALHLAQAEPASPPVPIAPAAPSGRQVPQGKSQIDLSFAPLVKQTAPAVVNVYAARTIATRSPFAGDPFFEQFFGGGGVQQRPRVERALGSGVIVDPSGLVVTNNHVVADADEVKVALSDGREFDCEVLLKDAKADLAVLKLKGGGKFPVLPIADSDALEIGDLVIAIGNPFGIGQTVTSGIVSALARTHIGTDDFGYFIQTDAAINPGNSGGALIGMQGQLVGINTAIFSRSGGSLGIGFAIPSNMVRAFVEAAKNGGRFERAYIGAGFAPVTPDIAEALGLDRPTGALVQSVTDGGPADKAGLAVGDVIMAMDGFEITDPDALGYRLATGGIGRTTHLDVLVDGRKRDIALKLLAAPEDPPRDVRDLSGQNPFSGCTVANLSPRVADELEMPQNQTGVVITKVERGSIAARLGFQPKDIVTQVNREPIDSTAALEKVLDRGARGWRFEIDRGGRRLTQVVR
ncbi:DegQ family serine endoprotease [Aurantimonas sp. MSK8Z-1]|uniref:DegQ family serine endoprotease n=1 Tax=Mangrovibrevibacter kandeliae TaxID=2968473 RepID=UPI00211897E2|nr:DegQ family serine endoprotease [Aurantimonas sp. MSK8Z-1]